MTATLAAAAALALAAVASANEIDVDKAKKRTERVAKQLCEADPDCQSYTARYCDKSTDHKAKCIAFHTVRRETGERQVCRTPVTIRLSHDTGRYRVANVGETNCS